MKRYPIIIKSSNAEIAVYFEKRSWLKKFLKSDFLKAYIPACEIISYQKGRCQFNFLAKKGIDGLVINSKNAIYSSNKYRDEDIVTLIEFILEKIRQRNGEYCMHSSTVIINGRGIVIWGGATSMGKTCLALVLSKTKGAIFYSDEKTLINLKKNSIVGGVNSIYVSKQYLREKYGNINFHNIENIETWRNREFPISFMVYPYLEIKKSSSVEIENWSAEKFNWHLYEELSRKIRGTSRRIFNNSLPVLSIDDLSIAMTRSLEVKRYTSKINCYYMRGNGSSLSKNILKILG